MLGMADAAVWLERVEAWRASGLTAVEFAAGEGFAASTLRSWSWRLAKKGRTGAAAPGFVRLVPRKSGTAPDSAVLTIEVGGARVLVGAGFDRAALREVIELLQGVGSAR